MIQTTKMMDLIINDYNDTYNTIIDSIYCIPALEADTEVGNMAGSSNAKPDKPMNPTTMQKFRQRIQQAIETLTAILTKFLTKLGNSIKRLLQSDQAFIKNCRYAIVNHKPLEGVKLIAYQYNDNALDTAYRRIISEINKKIESIKKDIDGFHPGELVGENGEDLTPGSVESEEDITKDILSKLSVPSEVDSLPKLLTFMRDGYRQEKKEMLFTANQTTQYYQIATGGTNIQKALKNQSTALEAQHRNMTARLKQLSSDPNFDAPRKNRLLMKIRSLSHLYNLETHIIDFYGQLRIEKVFTYRAVLKKLYHFT